MESIRPAFERLLLLVLLTGALACVPPEPDELWTEPTSPQAQVTAAVFPVPPPPFSKRTIFPCSDCHVDLPVNTQRRDLDEHTKIKLNHGTRDRWCFDCHNPRDRDRLRLVGDALVPFEESYRLCGQCHGDKLRDWKAGIHGKRTGSWNGDKQYLLCVHCHDAHSPRFKPIEPLPPPVRPAAIH